MRSTSTAASSTTPSTWCWPPAHPGDYGLAEMDPLIEYGASPRASLGLVAAGRALALLRGRRYALPQDVFDVAPEVLRHRLVLSYEALAQGLVVDQITARVLSTVPAPRVTPILEGMDGSGRSRTGGEGVGRIPPPAVDPTAGRGPSPWAPAPAAPAAPPSASTAVPASPTGPTGEPGAARRQPASAAGPAQPAGPAEQPGHEPRFRHAAQRRPRALRGRGARRRPDPGAAAPAGAHRPPPPRRDAPGRVPGPGPGHGTEPGEAREYQPGDDVRRIDWNVTARLDSPHTRETIADRELQTWALVDLSPQPGLRHRRLREARPGPRRPRPRSASSPPAPATASAWSWPTATTIESLPARRRPGQPVRHPPAGGGAPRAGRRRGPDPPRRGHRARRHPAPPPGPGRRDLRLPQPGRLARRARPAGRTPRHPGDRGRRSP